MLELDPRDRVLIRSVDALHDHADLDDELATDVLSELGEAGMLDLFVLCGWYHAISYAANGARVAHEPGAPFVRGRPARPERWAADACDECRTVTQQEDIESLVDC